MNDVTIHGSILVFLQQFVDGYKAGFWPRLLQDTGLGSRAYDIHQNYPFKEFERLVTRLSQLLGTSVPDLHEKLGEKLVPALLGMYGRYVQPEWKTFELLMYTEMIMHKAVRQQESKAAPPILNISRVHDKLLMIDYFSKRKLSRLAVGIIKGIARHYNESEKVKVIPMSEPYEERVQIRIEFDR